MPGCRYRLTYFPIQGRAELIRLIFHAARVPFEDRRIAFAEWKDLKPKMPNGTVPVFEIDGQVFDENVAIVNWAAKKFGLIGKTDTEELETACIMDQSNAFREKFIGPMFTEKDPEKLKVVKAELVEGLKKLLTKWESTVLVTQSNHKKTYYYMVTHSLTAADLTLLYLTDLAAEFCDVDWAPFPRLAGVLRTVRAIPHLKEYLQCREGLQPGVHKTTQTDKTEA